MLSAPDCSTAARFCGRSCLALDTGRHQVPELHEPARRIPVICVDHSTAEAADIFNPNNWTGSSKEIIFSSWTEFSVLRHCARQIGAMVPAAEHLCANSIAELQEQWRRARFPLDEMVFFAQHAELHIRIEAFFSGAKSLLDLLVQLLSTERIVGTPIDGFHRTKDIYGGRVLNALENNAVADRREAADAVRHLLFEHKELWIDEAIAARDLLVHPERGRHQLMFNLELAEREGELVCQSVNPPHVNDIPIHEYAEQTFGQATEFSSAFLALARGGARV